METKERPRFIFTGQDEFVNLDLISKVVPAGTNVRRQDLLELQDGTGHALGLVREMDFLQVADAFFPQDLLGRPVMEVEILLTPTQSREVVRAEHAKERASLVRSHGRMRVV